MKAPMKYMVLSTLEPKIAPGTKKALECLLNEYMKAFISSYCSMPDNRWTLRLIYSLLTRQPPKWLPMVTRAVKEASGCNGNSLCSALPKEMTMQV